jgi:8-oxo-dGTP diphosphatase
MTRAPQFGEPEPGRDYPDRPAAFGVAFREGEVAVVRVRKPGAKAWLDLPGGALDPGEDAPAAVAREFGEETGLVVKAAGPPFASADQYFVNTDDQAFNNRAAFFEVEVQREQANLKIEDDHTLEWIDPFEAVTVLRHQAHAWAVAAWLRLRAARIASARGTG